MSPRTWTAAISDGELSGLEWGDPAQPALLALHGWLDNAGSFALLGPAIRSRRVIAPDLAGHGLSSHKSSGWAPFLDNLGDVLELADALGLARFDLLGHSMGGAIATLVAAAYPERIGKLVLLDALGPLARPSEQFPSDLRRGFDARRSLNGKQPPVYPTREAALAVRMRASGLSQEATERLLERGLREDADGFRWRTDPRLTVPSPHRASEPQIQAALAAIQCPVLLLLADPATPYLDGDAARERIATFRDATLVRVPGSHHQHLEDAAPFADAIDAFL